MNSIKLYKLASKTKIKIISKTIEKIIFLLYNSVIPSTAIIGDKSRLNYGGVGVVIHKDAIIGNQVVIGTNVTIGGNFNGKKPILNNNIYVSTGAKILGCEIGDYVIVGANSVVTKDIPSGSVVAGTPGRVIREINDEERKYLMKLQ